MSMKLYVGNLPYSFSNEELEQLFQPYGEVESATIINDRETGRSKGFGFVEMTSREEAEAAIEGLDGMAVGDRELKVNEARPREDRGGGSRGGYGGGSRGGSRGGYGGGRGNY